MIENLVKSFNEDDIKELSLKKLLDLYFKCSNAVYFRSYEKMDSILDVIRKIIVTKLKNSNLFDIVYIYYDVSYKFLKSKESLQSNQNIIDARNLNLKDDFYIQYESKRRKKTPLEFIKIYKDELKIHEENGIYLEKSCDSFSKLQNDMLNIINDFINRLSNEERNILLIKLNNEIESKSIEILKRNTDKKNRNLINYQLKNMSTEDVYKLYDNTELMNMISILFYIQQILKVNKKEK